MQRIFWGDLHNHNEIGYGKGSLERTYRIARNTLDICAFSAHGFWPDPPASDPQMVDYHLQAFDRISQQFPVAVAEANAQYKPGKFVTLIAYEWHSIQWGDFVILFPGSSGELYRGADLEDISDYARSQGALLIPHHSAYLHGWRGTAWDALDPELSPLVEVHSEHGSSFDRESIWPMVLHSMGGSTASQTVVEQLRRGRHIGFTAGTDNHFGYPATYGEGITGVVAPELTREAVFGALRNRHTLAATGDRIELSVMSNGAMMGDILPATAPRRFEIDVAPLGPIEFVQMIKNGQAVQMWPGGTDPSTPEDGAFLVRVEWGWGRMDHPELTIWEIELDLQGGRFGRTFPCFAGGAGSVELTNLLHRRSETAVEIASYTSRHNPVSMSGVVLEIEGDGDTLLGCDVQATSEGEQGGCEMRETVSRLIADDVWGKPFERFSSPRIRVGRAYGRRSLAFRQVWQDPEPGERDTYVVKVQQKNGQIAWASPILFE